MKKIFAVLLTLVMMFSFASVAFAADYNWGKEPVSCEKYTIDITKYEMVVEDGKSKLVESANVAAKKGDTVYFSIAVYDEKGNSIVIYDEQTEQFYGEVSFTGLKATPTLYSKSKAIFKGEVYSDIPCITVKIEQRSSIEDLKEDNIIATYTDYPAFIRIGNIVFERNANYYVVNAYQYDEKLESEKDEIGRIPATESQLAALGMSISLIDDGVYLVNADTIVKNLGTYCLAEKTVCWGTPVVSGTPNDTLGIPKTGDASIGMYIGAALVILGIAGGAWYVVSKRKESAN